MRATPSLAAGLAAALLASPVPAQDYKLGDIDIGHPYVIASTGRSAAGYFSVTNHGATADSLVAIRTDFPRSEVHGTETDASGVSRMSRVPALEIPAGGTVTLQPGGLHVMLMGLDHPLAAGDEVAATLVFENAGEVAVVFQVQARGKGAAGDAMPGMSR